MNTPRTNKNVKDLEIQLSNTIRYKWEYTLRMQLEYLCKIEERVNLLNMEVSFLEMTKDIKPSTKSDMNTWQLLQPSKHAQFPKQSHFHSQKIFLPSLSYILGKGKSHILLVMIFKPDNHALSDIVIGSEKNLITLVTHTFLSNQAFQ